MLSTSPASRSAASPTDSSSSQSSSVGSAYASSPSTASSTRLQLSSEPVSSTTSPATLSSDRASVQSRASTRAKGAAHAPKVSHASFATTSTNPFSPSQRIAQPSADTESTGLRQHHPSHVVSDSMSQPESAHDWANTVSRQPSTSTSAAELQHTLSTSPSANRGPATKTRRTSPGGSRASGDLHATSGKSLSHHAENVRKEPSAELGPNHSPQASLHRDAASPSQPPLSISGSGSSRRIGTDLSQGNQSVHASTDFPYRDSSAGSSSDVTNLKSTSAQGETSQSPRMNLAKHPPQELLKVLATLLHEIASANDEFQPESGKDDKRSRRGPRSRDRTTPSTPAEDADGAANSSRGFRMPHGSHLSFNDERRPSVTTAALGALATPSSTLCFHARNVPSISIESYLLRILKYCPTTNEVFLSLLVYFDRMSRMGSGAKPGSNGDGELAGEAAGLPRASERLPSRLDRNTDSLPREDGTESAEPAYTHPGIRGFAIDSYNVHRLVIAGVTVASKFFSDVFYTNSRYAKVGGLPPHELNQLELQFLLLNDFRLTIPLEEMQRYADQLLMYGSGHSDRSELTKELKPLPQDAIANSSNRPEGEAVGAGTTAAPQSEMDSQGDVQMQDA